MLLALLIFGLGCIEQIAGQATSGPVGPIIIYDVNQCTPPINEVGFSVTLNEGDHKSLSFKVDLPFEINDDTYLVVTMDKWEMSTWKEEFFRSEGTLFENIQKYIPAVFDNIKAVMDPPLDDDNLIGAGERSVNDFKEIYENLDVPQIFYGRFKIKLTASDDDHGDFLCVMAEFEAQEP